jgi:hypothetical protein
MLKGQHLENWGPKRKNQQTIKRSLKSGIDTRSYLDSTILSSSQSCIYAILQLWLCKIVPLVENVSQLRLRLFQYTDAVITRRQNLNLTLTIKTLIQIRLLESSKFPLKIVLRSRRDTYWKWWSLHSLVPIFFDSQYKWMVYSSWIASYLLCWINDEKGWIYWCTPGRRRSPEIVSPLNQWVSTLFIEAVRCSWEL